MAKPAWKRYEEYIVEEVREWAGPDAKIEFDVNLPALQSGGTRQIDILVTGDFAGGMLENRTAAIDCKCYSKKINVTHADKFVGLIDDVQTDFGILVTTKGWSKKAEARLPSRLELRLVENEPAMAMAMIDLLPEPMWPVEFGEDHYTGDFWEVGRNGTGAKITYNYVERESPFPIDHPDQLEWLDEVVAMETVDQLNWADATERREAGRLLLRHYLSREPTTEELDSFVFEVASAWEDGQEWCIEVSDIRTRTGLWPEIKTGRRSLPKGA
jgi:hypothetical protein